MVGHDRPRPRVAGRPPRIRRARSPATRSQVSKDGGPGAARSSRTGGAARRDLHARFDTAYRFRVRALDTAGNWSPWVDGGRHEPRPSVRRPQQRRSTSASLDGPRRARARIKLDPDRIEPGRREDRPAPSPAMPSRSSRREPAPRESQGLHRRRLRPDAQPARRARSASRRVLFARYFPAGGTHTITLEVVGTGTYPLVRLDAFVVSS